MTERASAIPVDVAIPSPSRLVPLTTRQATPSRMPATLPVGTRSTGARVRAGLALAGESWIKTYLRRAVALDLAAALLAGGTAIVFSDRVPLGDRMPSFYLWALLIAPLAWVAAIAQSRGYERRYLGVGTEEFRSIPRAGIRLLATATFASYVFLGDGNRMSRFVVLSFFPLCAGLSLALRYGLRQRLHHRRWHGQDLNDAVVVGRADAALSLIRDLERDPSHGMRAVAACTSSQNLLSLNGVRMVEGSVAETLEVVDRLNAETVLVASPSELTGPELRRLSWELEDRDVDLIVSPGIMEVAGPRLSIRPAANLSLLHVERPALHGGRALTKSIFDRVMSLLLVIVALPIALVAAVAIKLETPGPILFRQPRVGAEGKTFQIFKFRSMTFDAEDRLADLSDEANDGNGVLFKRKNDPRVTNVGKFLRRYSIDELPQLLNVLRGDMSLIGPRPPLQSEVDQYEPDAVRRLRVRPGLTGLWQVSGRSDLSWDESVRLDLRYVDNWSMMLDLQILWRTARAVLRGSGAY